MLSMGNFLGKFSNAFSTTVLWSTYEQLLTWIFYYVSNPVILTFFSSDIWLSKMKSLFSTFIPVSNGSRHYLNYLLPREVCTSLQIKKFPLMKFWYIFLIYGVLISKVTILKNTHLINIYSFWHCLSRDSLLIRPIIITLFQ